MKEEHMKLSKASKFLDIPKEYLRKLADEGSIKNERNPDGHRVFLKKDLYDYLKKQSSACVEQQPCKCVEIIPVSYIDKTHFTKLIKAIKKQMSVEFAISKKFECTISKKFDKFPRNNFSSKKPSKLIDSIVEVLEDIFKIRHDEKSIIRWWLFETHYSAKKELFYLSENKKIVSVSLDTPGQLYDFLLEIASKKQ